MFIGGDLAAVGQFFYFKNFLKLFLSFFLYLLFFFIHLFIFFNK